MGNKNTTLLRGTLQHGLVVQPFQPRRLRGLKVNCGFAAQYASKDGLPEILVGLKTKFHDRRLTDWRRAAWSFRRSGAVT